MFLFDLSCWKEVLNLRVTLNLNDWMRVVTISLSVRMILKSISKPRLAFAPPLLQTGLSS
jgi:hypothetical protein